jgi:Protein of unknown function (DUF3300)
MDTNRRLDGRRVIAGLGVLAALVTLVAAPLTRAQAPAAASADAVETLSPEELERLVGPIALYPDDLVALILPASTNPLQLVQADRFLEKRKTDPKLPIDDRWDDSVKTLLNYPEVVKQMSSDLDWTADLGEAVVADQGGVLDAVQAFRRKAQAAGNLKTDPKQVVEVDKQIITIVPADPQVIYVPQYNPATVVVYSAAPVYGYYPVAYPSYYYPYPPGAALATGLIWGAAIGAAWNGGHWNTHWGGGYNNNITINRGDVNINRGNINTGNINTGNINRGNAGNRPSQGGGTAWQSNKRPGQVSSAAGRPSNTSRVGDSRPGGSTAGTGARPVGGGGAGARPSTPAGGGMAQGANASRGQLGGASASGAATRNAAGGGQGAFGGYGSGGAARADSSRGAASRSSMPSQGARPSAGGGGARASGGGGARAGGGAPAGGGGGGRGGRR